MSPHPEIHWFETRRPWKPRKREITGDNSVTKHVEERHLASIQRQTEHFAVSIRQWHYELMCLDSEHSLLLTFADHRQ